jgi:hypothetical protein
MRKIIYFLLLIIVSSVQAQLRINFEDAYTFKRIYNTYVLVESVNTKTVFQADKNGWINLAMFSGEVKLTFYAEAYETIQATFDASEETTIKAILEPKIGYIPQILDEDVLLKAYITDATTGKPFANAIVSFAEYGLKLKSDEKGYFILNKKDIQNYNQFKAGDEINYTIEADGYQVIEGTNKFTTATLFAGYVLKPKLKPELARSIISTVNEAIITSSLTTSTARSASFTCNSLPASIRVGTGCSCNTCSAVSVMGIEVYTRKGLNDEWIASWQSESLKAGSLPYKSYGAYHVSHPIATNFDISSTTCRQVWDSDYATACINACSVTQGLYMVTSTDTIAFTEYSAENNGMGAPAGTGCGDGYAGNGTSSPCISDALCAGHDRYGHGRGMCQWGTQRWALNGKTYQWIADHYYNPVNIYRCDGSSAIALDCTNAITLSCGVSYHGASSTAASNVGQYACNSWTETGPERVHTWTATGDGAFTVTVSNYTGDLDVYILGSCDPSDCLGTVSSSSSTYANAVSGQTYYIVVDADDSSGSAYDLVVDCSSLSVTEIALEDAITIAPNPSEGIFTISTENVTIKIVRLYNALGQYLKSVAINRVDLSGFAAGFYYLEIETIENKKSTFKIIKR